MKYHKNIKNKRKYLVGKIDYYFKRCIRYRDTDWKGYGKCITCGIIKEFKDLEGGHFMPCGRYSTRWDERNVNAQCSRCNNYGSGEQAKYFIAIDKKFGPGTAESLVKMSEKQPYFSIKELEDMLLKYKNKLKEYENG